MQKVVSLPPHSATTLTLAGRAWASVGLAWPGLVLPLARILGIQTKVRRSPSPRLNPVSDKIPSEISQGSK